MCAKEHEGNTSLNQSKALDGECVGDTQALNGKVWDATHAEANLSVLTRIMRHIWLMLGSHPATIMTAWKDKHYEGLALGY